MVLKQCPLLKSIFWYLICCATCFGSRDNSKYHTYPLTQPPIDLRPTWPRSDFHRLFFFCFVLCVLRPSIYFICIGLASNFCVMYGDRRRVGLPTSRARARVRRLTPTDRYPRDSNPGPLDLKSSILPLSYLHRTLHRLFDSGFTPSAPSIRLNSWWHAWHDSVGDNAVCRFC